MSRRSGGSSGGRVYVSGYTRSNGTFVAPHYRSAPSSGGGSRSSGASSASSSTASVPSVSVSGYTRSDGTYVQGYTRSAPSSGSSSRASSASSTSRSDSGSVSVSGYCRSDGTYVQPHTRAAPGTASKSSQASASSSTSKTATPGKMVEVSGYTRKDGTQVRPHTRFVPTKSVNEAGEDVYCDNAYNRKLSRVGKPIPPRESTQTGDKRKGRRSSAVKNLTNQYTLDQIFEWLEKLRDRQRADELAYVLDRFGIDADNEEAMESVCEQSFYKMERASVEEKWAKEGVAARTNSDKLSRITQIIDRDDVQLQGKIGHGGFGEVFAATWKGTPVAVKKLLMQSMSKHRLDTFKKEVEVLAMVDHPNIVRLFGAIVEPLHFALVMEYMKCSLFTAIFIDEEHFTPSQQHNIILQVVEALEHLHSKDIAHCDVKTENVLLDDNLSAKLTDFGLSSIRTATESSMSSAQGGRGARGPGRGTPRYSAPEVLRGEDLSTKDHMRCDVYSLSLVVFEVYVREEVFEDLSLMQLIRQVGNGDKRPTLPDDLDKGVCNMMIKSWQSSAADRPSPTEFKKSWQALSNVH